MRWSTSDLDKEFIEELTHLKKRFENCTSKGCLTKIFQNPVNLEPQLLKPFPGDYNRNTKDIDIFKLIPSTTDEVTPEISILLLDSMRGLHEPVSFELIGSSADISIQIVTQKRDRRIIANAINSTYAHSYLQQTRDSLFARYKEMAPKRNNTTHSLEFAFNDYYLNPPYYFPINTFSRDFSGDLLDSVFDVISKLPPEELGFYQVLFIPAKNYDWAKLSRTLIDMTVQREEYAMKNTWFEDSYQPVQLPTTEPVGQKFHPVLGESDLKEHRAKAYEKTKDKKPFYCVSLRIGLFARKGRAEGIFKVLGNALYHLIPGDRALRFLTREDYYKAGIPEKLHYYMFFNRVSLREGMLLTSNELAGLVHFPTPQSLEKDYPIEIAKGRRPVPDFLTAAKEEGIVIGDGPYKGKKTTVVLTHRLRAQHCHIVGKTGFGKSTLIENCVLQDIEQGTGVCLIDPHGELIENHLVPKLPSECMDKVIYFDPIRTPLPINILEARNKKERIALADDVASIFRRYTDSWGVQIEEILSFGVQAVLSSREGGHLGTLRTFLLYPEVRKKYLNTVEDEFVIEFWRDQFPLFPNQKGAITTATRRLNQLLRSPVLQAVLTNKESAINFREAMDNGYILLINIPIGELGQINAFILGSLIISKIQAAALTRQDIPLEQRKPFYLYIDEFQHFLCQSIEESLTGTRKYALGLVLAHNSLGQISARDKAVADAVLEVPNTRICFQVGDNDSVALAKGFTHYTREDLKNLREGEAIMRVGGSSNDFEINTRYDPIDDKTIAPKIKEALIHHTLTRFGINAAYHEPKEDVNEAIPTDVIMVPRTSKREENIYIQHSDQVSRRRTGSIELKPEEKRFLQYLSELTRILPVRDVYRELELSTYKGDSLKKTLLKAGLIAETEADLGRSKRKSKILALTSTGYGVLGLPPLPGKGGPAHQFLQKIIAQRARQKGYEAAIEEVTLNGSQVDIGLSKDNKTIAVEVSVTTRPDQIINNIVLALQGGYDEVVSLFTLSETLIETQKLLSGPAKEIEAQKIQLKLVSEYESVL